MSVCLIMTMTELHKANVARRCACLIRPICVLQAGAGSAALADLQDSVSLRALSIMQGLAVSILNIAVGTLIPIVTKYEQNLTSTTAMLSLVLKLSLFYLLNSFIVPIVVVTVLPDSEELWCAPELAPTAGVLPG